jgi:hypothetical protein
MLFAARRLLESARALICRLLGAHSDAGHSSVEREGAMRDHASMDVSAGSPGSTLLPVAPMSPSAPYWTKAREETRAWLRRIGAPSLAELYETSVAMIETACPAYIRFVSHAVREIANGLPRVLVAQYEGGNLDYATKLAEIRNEWATAQQPIEPAVALAGDVPIPARVVALWRGLLDDDRLVTGRVRRSATGLFLAVEVRRTGRQLTEGDVEAAVAEWLRLVRWFVKNAHDNQRPIDASDLKQNFSAFERTLSAFFQEYFPARGPLDEILAKTNS